MFTTPPILAIGAFDIDVSFNIMRKFPELYECGRINSDLNNRKMATRLIFSIIHSLAIFGWYVCFVVRRVFLVEVSLVVPSV